MKDDNTKDAWLAILNGLASSGELSPEELGTRGGEARVKTLAIHAAGLAKSFAAAFGKKEEVNKDEV